MTTPRLAIARLVTAIALAACSGGSARTPASTPGASATSIASPASQSPTPASTSTAGLVLVAFGDSIPGALNCPDGCTGYVELYGAEVAAAIGVPVEVRNLARTDSFTSKRLFQRLADPTYAAAAADADLIVIQIGFNDFQGPCTWANHAVCLVDGQAQVADYLERTLSAIEKLRDDRPVAMRIVTYYDNYVGDPNGTAEAWGFEPTADNIATFTEAYGEALRSFNEMLCSEAAAHHAICVDLVTAFNGPNGDQPPTGLISNDGIHPSTAGHHRIAEALAAAGFDDLRVDPPPSP